MGSAKPDLMFAGRTLLQRTVDTAAGVFDEIVLVDRTDGGRAGTVRAISERPHEGEAPIFGVQAALLDAQEDCFVLAVDYPLIRADILRFLRDAFAQGSEPMLVPEWHGRPQMLCAGYGAALLPLLERRLAAGRLDLRGLIDEAKGKIISESLLRRQFAGEPLKNVNTPAELEEALRLNG